MFQECQVDRYGVLQMAFIIIIVVVVYLFSFDPSCHGFNVLLYGLVNKLVLRFRLNQPRPLAPDLSNRIENVNFAIQTFQRSNK